MMNMMLALLAALAVQPLAADAGSAAAKPVCKQKPITGSRTKFEKVCLTAAEWRTLRENNGRALSEAQQRLGAHNYPGTVPHQDDSRGALSGPK